MKNYTDLQADLHIHTTASGHAYSTVSEIAAAAKEKGLKTIAITDHGPAMPGGAHDYHFDNLTVLEPVQNGIRILKGIEANIVNSDGSLDIQKGTLERLDIVLATFHSHCGYKDLGAEENTKTLIRALKKNKIDIIAHPGNQLFKLDYDAVAKAAKELGVIIEFNNSSYAGSSPRQKSDDLDQILAKACQKYGNKIVISSDAHVASSVGDFEAAWNLVKNAEIADEQILNLDSNKLLDYLENKH